jgi:ABC-type branched-subunit amino acid transport system permease subunit
MRFGEIIEAIRDGTKRAQRLGWNGKGMYIYIEMGKIIKK